jgi:hypothetical protein
LRYVRLIIAVINESSTEFHFKEAFCLSPEEDIRFGCDRRRRRRRIGDYCSL